MPPILGIFRSLMTRSVVGSAELGEGARAVLGRPDEVALHTEKLGQDLANEFSSSTTRTRGRSSGG